MTTPALFATYLHDAMSARRMPLDELEHGLEGVRREEIESWLNGWAVPDVNQLIAVAQVLRREPVEVAAAWLIDRLPALHEPVYEAVLKPRGSIFPSNNDLAIRAPERHRTTGERIDVGDPHDAERPLREAMSIPERTFRKRPLTRAR